MDLQKLIPEVVGKLQNDSGLLDSFKANPVKALESLLGVDLPDEQLNLLIQGVKAKLNLDSVGGVEGVLNGITSLFGKK